MNTCKRCRVDHNAVGLDRGRVILCKTHAQIKIDAEDANLWSIWLKDAPGWAEFHETNPRAITLHGTGCENTLKAFVRSVTFDPPTENTSPCIERTIDPPVYHLTLIPTGYNEGD